MGTAAEAVVAGAAAEADPRQPAGPPIDPSPPRVRALAVVSLIVGTAGAVVAVHLSTPGGHTPGTAWPPVWSVTVAADAGRYLVARPGTARDRKSTRLNSSHSAKSRMPSSA